MQLVEAVKFPAIAFVKTVFVDGYVTVGTASLIGPRLLLTAGHVVFDYLRVVNNRAYLANDGRPSVLHVTLGGSVSPRFTMAASEWRCNQTWHDQHSKAPVATRIRSAFDYGAIVLPEAVDHRVGMILTPEATASSAISHLQADVGGFPAAAYFNLPTPRPPLNKMYISGANNCQSLNGYPHRIVYAVQTVKGMSGGPFWTYNAASGHRTIHGIHTSLISGVGGSSLRISDVVMQEISQWQSSFP